jgi:hypothetical protein
LNVQEVLVDTQEPDQGTLGEGLSTLLEAYSDEEQVAASTEPQEPVEKPTQEHTPTKAEDPTQGNKEQTFVISPKIAESTSQAPSPKPQEPQVEKEEQFGKTKDREDLEVLIDIVVSILKGNKQEIVPLDETTRDTLDESNDSTLEDKWEMELEAPTVTQ